jgi:hypothetical protein
MNEELGWTPENDRASKVIQRHIAAITSLIKTFHDREVRVSAATATARTILLGSFNTGGEEAESMMLLIASYLSDAMKTLGKARLLVEEE